MPKTDVFERSGSDTLSRNTFYLAMGMVLTWGFALTAVVANATAGWHPGVLMFLLVGLVIPMIGVMLSTSENPVISFIAFNLVAVPEGAILGPLLAQYTKTQPGIVGECALLTAAVAVAMGVTGLLFPHFYESIGGALFGALLALLVVLIITMFVPALMHFGIIQYGAALIFALYIGYDMHRASEIPSTLDNAVDVSLALYLDVINLFLWILQIRSRNDD